MNLSRRKLFETGIALALTPVVAAIPAVGEIVTASPPCEPFARDPARYVVFMKSRQVGRTFAFEQFQKAMLREFAAGSGLPYDDLRVTFIAPRRAWIDPVRHD
ncbi:MAG: hypothetical protein AB7I36_08440 [Rhodospirillaceae bacterium]